ncbi:MAG: polysaccharide ABC transporter ATP-binding protein [Gemmatimonadota bacterium]
MSKAPIEFHRVWKKFHRGELHDSLRDLVPAIVRRLTKGRPPGGELEGDEFWAVRDVSFEVAPGETLGIIGPNGAGKSTILKLLTKILRPNLGDCSVPGRVGALIEVAAGFHPDLTGRENVFLQGAIMGMRQAEIATKFDQIVEFSGLPSFIDTQVKRYSSGMNARLGFAIAAHLDPDVLLVDEVLAVGDYGFQKKAFGRIAEMARRDIPVVIVSHQLDRIAALCTKAILLDEGKVTRSGAPTDCIAAYIAGQETVSEREAGPDAELIRSVTLASPRTVRSGERLDVRAAGAAVGLSPGDLAGRSVAFRVRELQGGNVLFQTGTGRHEVDLPPNGDFEIALSLQMNVPPGLYSVDSFVWDADQMSISHWGPSLTVEVSEGVDFKGSVQLNPELSLESRAPTDLTDGLQSTTS